MIVILKGLLAEALSFHSDYDSSSSYGSNLSTGSGYGSGDGYGDSDGFGCGGSWIDAICEELL